MSSGIGAIYDDHRDYLALCDELEEFPLPGLPLASYKQWSEHWAELKKRAAPSTGTADKERK